ncbi:hypothetical protein H8S33_06490 [Ornithinibacillus sp. BX22]|uniref:LPXTG cell wall anchor domain-containing protein n=1 Tax=Ornithinibacillus hominis TaxID=2763055 RepID=A0A923RJL6_9BACI|nr:SpaA isopeptide-forming pilin-related protein [Ornithinibacillus hominis]MBC5636472.1 hypothetical protein [Ornithinibacillus hominis]
MGKRMGISFFILMLLCNTILSSMVLPIKAGATEQQPSLFTNVSLLDEQGKEVSADRDPEQVVQPGSHLMVRIDWKWDEALISDQETFTLQLPSELKVTTEPDGNLTNQAGSVIGSVTIVESALTVDVMKEEIENGDQGQIYIETSLGEIDLENQQVAHLLFNLDKATYVIPIQVVHDQEDLNPESKDPLEEEASGEQVVEEQNEQEITTEKPNEPEEEVQTQAVQNASVIKENILTGVELTLGDGSPLPDRMPHPSEEILDLKIQYQFELPNGHEYTSGSTFTFTLPEIFTVFNRVEGELTSADGIVFGAFVLEQDGTVTMTFNDQIESRSDIAGFIGFHTEIKEDIDGSVDRTIVIPISGDKTIEIPIRFEPNVGSSIDKRGIPDRKYNTQTITWEIDFNKDLRSITNAVLSDNLDEDLQLVPNSIKLYKLDVQLDGSVVQGAEITDHVFTEFPLNLGDIDSAYRVVFETTITDEDGTSYPNTATLTGDDIDALHANATVNVARGTALDKEAGDYDPINQTINWIVRYNYNEKHIEKEKAVLHDELGEGHELVEGSVRIVPVEIDPNTGAATIGDTELDPSHYTVRRDGNGFNIQFNEAIDSAYIIYYQTKLTDRVLDRETLTNMVTDGNGNEKGSDKTVDQIVFYKQHINGQTDYHAKTTKWRITINADEKEMYQVKLTDTLPKGLTLIDYEIKYDGSDIKDNGNYIFGYDEDSGEITFDFEGMDPINKRIEIVYTTSFDFNEIEDGKTTFTNGAELSWIPENGNNPLTKEADASFTPNKHTQSNGFKGGSYNAKTKEITWEIGVNYNYRPIQQAIVEDVILGDQNFDPSTIEIHEMRINPNGSWSRIGEPLKINRDYDVEEMNGPNQEPGFRITFLTTIDSPYIITYKTNLHDQLIVKQYENTALLKDGSEQIATLSATVSVGPNGDNYMDKSAQQDGENPRVLHWKLNINFTQSTISDAKVTDKPSPNQLLLEDSLQLYGTNVAVDGTVTKNEDDVLEAGVDYTVEFKEDEEGNSYFTLSFANEINRPYILEYDTFIMAGHGEEVENDASLDGAKLEGKETDSSYKHTVRYTGGDGGIDGRTGSLEVIKLDELTEEPLAGAEFTLYDQTGTIAIKSATTNNEGKIIFHNLLFGEYQLVETKAPEGYVIGETQPITVTIDRVDTEKIGNHLEVTNKKIIYAVELTKVDEETRDTIAGASFILQQKQDDVFETIGYYKTDENGIIFRDNLAPGDYQFVEVQPAPGYQLNPIPIPFTIMENQTAVTKVTAGNYKLGAVELIKFNQADETETLAGAEFTLYDENDNVLQQILRTDNAGRISVSNLVPGTYYFQEIKAPDYFELDPSPIEFVIEPGVTKRVTVNAPNTLITGEVLLTKVDDTNPDIMLAGAEFSLLDAHDNVLQEGLKTNEDGELFVDGLAPGDYKFVETKAPTYYQLNEQEIPFTIDRAKTKTEVMTVELTVENKLIPGSVELIKVDSDNHDITLSGAEFELQDSEGNVLKEGLVTDEEGRLVIENLKPGTYQFIETKAPTYYQLLDEPIVFEIVKGQKETLTVTAENELITGAVELIKVDADDHDITLSGAEFELQDSEGNVLKEGLVTDKEGRLVVENLKPGTYQFVETKAPTYYQLLDEPIVFEIVKGQEETLVVTAENDLITGAVELIKVDTEDHNITLSGAEFELQDSEGNVLQEGLVTDEEGKLVVNNLKPGDYQFVETKAPFGYDLIATPIEFTIDLIATEEEQELVVVYAGNDLSLGAVELIKVDADDHDITLSGAEFELQDSEGNVLQEGLVTNEEGKLVVENLKPGTYQFVETKAPTYYQFLDEPIVFEIVKGQEETLTVTAENKLIPGSVELIKVDADDQDITLSGAEFELQDSEGNVLKEGLVTDEEGRVVVENLKPGIYQFVETKAPEGYELNSTPIPFTIEKGQQEQLVVYVRNQLIPAKPEEPTPPEKPVQPEDPKSPEKPTLPEEPGNNNNDHNKKDSN